MDCNVIRDLIPLYIDECCSEESKKAVEEHLEKCADCKRTHDEMKGTLFVKEPIESQKNFNRISEWKASLLLSAMLFLSFGLITLGVAGEAATPSDPNSYASLLNGYYAISIVIPATAFMLSLANWFFVRVYKNRNVFSSCAALVTLGIAVAAYVWAWLHYDINILLYFVNASPLVLILLFETSGLPLALYSWLSDYNELSLGHGILTIMIIQVHFVACTIGFIVSGIISFLRQKRRA